MLRTECLTTRRCEGAALTKNLQATTRDQLGIARSRTLQGTHPHALFPYARARACPFLRLDVVSTATCDGFANRR